VISLLLIPFLVCVLLVFVHVYFGSFVLKRGILFIDLALAQWAALGYIVGHILHVHHPIMQFGISFFFTIAASVILATLKKVYPHIHSQEAVIGVMYIFSSALAIGLIATFGLEGVHLTQMLAGHLLFISQQELIQAVLIYGAVILCSIKAHSFFHRETFGSDLLFYVLFGSVVTSSVKMVGVLLVFSFLVIPVLTVSFFSSKLKTQLLWGWLIGVVASTMGLIGSILLDIPPSYSVILTLCFAWVSILGLGMIWKRRELSS